MIITTALYAWVSTPNQEEEDTIDSQVAAIEEYIKKKGYNLPADFSPLLWAGLHGGLCLLLR